MPGKGLVGRVDLTSFCYWGGTPTLQTSCYLHSSTEGLLVLGRAAGALMGLVKPSGLSSKEPLVKQEKFHSFTSSHQIRVTQIARLGGHHQTHMLRNIESFWKV